MFARLFIGIVAVVLMALGVVFGIIGLLSDADGAEDMAVVGGVLLVVGLVLAAIALAIHRRLTVQRRRRMEGGRATADVLDARLHAYTRVGVLLTYTATIRFAGDDGVVRDHTRRLLVPPTVPLQAGGRVEVAYDRSDPANFEVIGTATS